ncbi:MAG: butyrate kinase [Bacteroidetes bacterium]|jgi:butyrate kinase|nr:butyrate kinase [Bacteroidota bacterium]MBT6687614.1 butyrate kinase [Bacteroidota bacterium]MBT7144753.1 butyrate kinase [Bacteroidota bacterium]MBT7491759.1 butyrate kinase [Bacteroidota bacterium]
MENTRIIAIKPEKSVTKVGVFQNSNLLFLKNVNHTQEELNKFSKVSDQDEYRADKILQELKNAEIRLDLVRAIVGRGGLIKPIFSGVYGVNDAMIRDLRNSAIADHHINLGGLIAHQLSKKIENSEAFIADPVIVDEMAEIATYSGLPNLHRKSIFHALSHKSVARKFAKSQVKEYEEMNLIVCHLGDGTSIGAHHNGKVIDVNQAFDGEGPFSFERAGSLPLRGMIKMCFSGSYTEREILNMIQMKGGMVAYFGTNSPAKIESLVSEGNKEVKAVYEAMAYQVSKYIGSMAPVLKGKVDAILLTGHMSQSKRFVNLIRERVELIAPIHIFPDEDTVKSLATNALLVMKGEIEAKVYE